VTSNGLWKTFLPRLYALVNMALEEAVARLVVKRPTGRENN
jgi:hypothetical protein